jgi:hypothetical protein
MSWIIYNINKGFILSTHSTEPTAGPGEASAWVSFNFLDHQPLAFFKYSAGSVVQCTEEEIAKRLLSPGHALINDLVNPGINTNDHRDINYKTQLKDGISLHPVHYFSDDGLIEKTELYLNYLDEQNKGILILVVDEVYTLNQNQIDLPKTAREVIARTKVRKWNIDEQDADAFNVDTKTTIKKYDTRRKKSDEGYRRRKNVIDRLTENVGLAGILSAAFTDENDANTRLIELLAIYSQQYNIYKEVGSPDMHNAIDVDAVTTWLDTVVIDNAYTQSMCPWMIGMTFREYIKDKLNGDIK